MILFIDTAQAEIIFVALIGKGKIIAKSVATARVDKSEALLLKMIDSLLKRNRIKLNNLKVVAVVSGPGGFSSLRRGIATANALAWSLRVPVIKVKTEQDLSQIKIPAIFKFKPISPKYGAEPNITVPKIVAKIS